MTMETSIGSGSRYEKPHTGRPRRRGRGSVCILAAALLLALPNESRAADLNRPAQAANQWKIYPSVDAGARRVMVDYTPTFGRHFTIADGVLTGACFLGKEAYEKARCKTFDGPGRIWATHADWPSDGSDFEMTFDYRWYWKEPPTKTFGDFPAMNVGFRLNAEGEGYFVVWGFLGQVRVYRAAKEDGGFSRIVGEGQFGRGPKEGVKVKIRAAGPIIKVKVWAVDKSEPTAWTVEALDDFSDTDETRFQSGAIAVGFNGHKLYDTAAYEFKNIGVRKLSEEEAKNEISFDPKIDLVRKATPGKHIALEGPMKFLQGDAAMAGFAKGNNLEAKATGDGIVLRSKDGKPAVLWIESDKPSWALVKKLAIRATAEGAARPLLVKRIVTEGKTATAYFDPRWREGVAAVLRDTDRHTANTSSFDFTPGTPYDLTYWLGHWIAWQIAETDKPKTGIRFRARPLKHVHRKSKTTFGIGVVGDGSVTLQAIYQK